MTIRPVDLQVLIPRATEVSKSQQVLDHHSTNQQQYNAEYWQQTSSVRQQTVQNTPKSEGGTVRRDSGKGKQKNSQDNTKEPPEKTNDDQAEYKTVLGSNIDIKT